MAGQVRISVPFISADETGPKHIEEVLHREQFEDLGLCLSLRAVAVFCSAGRALEDLCGDLLESLEKPVRQALQAWSLFWLQCLPRFHEQACSNGVSTKRTRASSPRICTRPWTLHCMICRCLGFEQQVILVGGSTRIPAVQNLAKEKKCCMGSDCTALRHYGGCGRS